MLINVVAAGAGNVYVICDCTVECHAKCHWSSGCSLQGVGKCDTKCVKGYGLRKNICVGMSSSLSYSDCLCMSVFDRCMLCLRCYHSVEV